MYFFHRLVLHVCMFFFLFYVIFKVFFFLFYVIFKMSFILMVNISFIKKKSDSSLIINLITFLAF